MCWVAAIPIAMQAGQMVMGGMQQDQATAAGIDQQRRQQAEMIKQMNIKDANFKLEERDLLESTINDLTASNMNRVRAMGTVRAAIGEGNLEGNSMNRVARVTEGDMLRESMGINQNYQRDYSVILGNRYSNQEQTISAIKAQQASEPRLKGRLENMLDPLGIGLNKLVDMSIAGSGFNKSAKKLTGKIQDSGSKSTGSRT